MLTFNQSETEIVTTQSDPQNGHYKTCRTRVKCPIFISEYHVIINNYDFLYINISLIRLLQVKVF